MSRRHRVSAVYTRSRPSTLSAGLPAHPPRPLDARDGCAMAQPSSLDTPRKRSICSTSEGPLPGEDLGLDLMQHGHRVASPFSNLGRGHPGRQPAEHAGVAKIVGALTEHGTRTRPRSPPPRKLCPTPSPRTSNASLNSLSAMQAPVPPAMTLQTPLVHVLPWKKEWSRPSRLTMQQCSTATTWWRLSGTPRPCGARPLTTSWF